MVDIVSCRLPSAVSRLTYCLLLTACCLLTLSACNESFQPYVENDVYYFSIYGYLDASADTQWVRVAPARQQLDTPPEIQEGIRVTLEHLESGRSAVMNDSLMSAEGDFNFINFWTTMDIGHSQTYRLRAERPDGAASWVTVTTPVELPTPMGVFGGGIGIEPTYSLYVDDSVEHLADVQTRWYVRIRAPGYEQKRLFSFSHRNDVEHIGLYGGVYTVEIRPEREEEQIMKLTTLPAEGEIEIVHTQIYVASGGPEWNEEISSMDDLFYALPGSFSNVENGLGYLVGIDSKTIPFKSCRNDQYELIPCEEEEPYW